MKIVKTKKGSLAWSQLFACLALVSDAARTLFPFPMMGIGSTNNVHRSMCLNTWQIKKEQRGCSETLVGVTFEALVGHRTASDPWGDGLRGMQNKVTTNLEGTAAAFALQRDCYFHDVVAENLALSFGPTQMK